MGIMLHSGAEVIDREALALLPTPPPQGPRHRPVPHIELVNRLTDVLGREVLAVGREREGFPGTALFGFFDFKCRLDATRGLSMGFRSSNWREKSIGLEPGRIIR